MIKENEEWMPFQGLVKPFEDAYKQLIENNNDFSDDFLLHGCDVANGMPADEYTRSLHLFMDIEPNIIKCETEATALKGMHAARKKALAEVD